MNKFSSIVKRFQASFPLMVAVSISVALLLVWVSLLLYNQSGAAQLDLSRPSFQAVRSQAQRTEPLAGFEPPMGRLTEKDLKEFEKLYTKQTTDMHNYENSFSSGALSDKSLGIKVQ